MKLLIVCIVCLFVGACSSLPSGNIKLHEQLGLIELGSPFTDNMVLQQGTEVAIYGFGEQGATVTVKGSWGAVSRTLVKSDGKWLLRLSTPKADKVAHSVSISSANHIMLNNVLMGEVWLASGQSNMEWPLSKTNEFEATLANLDCTNIRLLNVARNPQVKQSDAMDGFWQPCNKTLVTNFSAVAFHFAATLNSDLDVPVGIIHSSFGGTRINPWRPLSAFESNQQQIRDTNANIEKVLDRHKVLLAQGASKNELQNNLRRAPSFLYNGMIHPVVPYTLKGFIWYQGESNLFDGMHYAAKFKSLIKTWRERWTQDFKDPAAKLPFYFVQLAPYGYSKNPSRKVDTPYLLPLLRDGQASALDLPNTAMVVITDNGDESDIHPRNKQVVGDRLAKLALRDTYHRDILADSPQLQDFQIIKDKVYLQFMYDNGLQSKDGGALSCFEIAGEDQVFYRARAVLVDGKVKLSSPDVSLPVAVRFAWHELANPNLVNQAGLPARSFRTDNWDIANLPDTAK
ncbi:sialate O-acetylesterase [Glaciecola sp. SC05]|uniref:sialate O-acetylesterase n=1 Tax=Glaciecola sp. SC05 TaxID=1987355 RepID=UPI00352754EB